MSSKTSPTRRISPKTREGGKWRIPTATTNSTWNNSAVSFTLKTLLPCTTSWYRLATPMHSAYRAYAQAYTHLALRLHLPLCLHLHTPTSYTCLHPAPTIFWSTIVQIQPYASQHTLNDLKPILCLVLCVDFLTMSYLLCNIVYTF